MTVFTEHFSLEELTNSQVAARRGISNDPPPELLGNLHRTADFLELVRVRLNYNQVIIHSGYRCPELNMLVGGVSTSAHCKALAADIVCPGYGSPYSVALAIADMPEMTTQVDQLILEYGWVHVGLAEKDKEPRHQLLTKRSAKSPYETGLLV